MRVAASAIGALMVSLAIASCGGSSHPLRTQLGRYLSAVNRIEAQLETPLNTVDSINQQLSEAASAGATTQASTTSTTPHLLQLPISEKEQKLRQAHRQVAAVVARLRALTVPAPATHLQSLIVTLAERQEQLIVQTELLTGFASGYEKSLAPLAPAVTTLKRVLDITGASTTSTATQLDAQKASALRTFSKGLVPILASLGQLQPPSSSVPAYDAERRSLTEMRAAALSLAGDLATANASKVPSALRAFDAAAGLPSTRRVQLAERAAIKAYDRQVSSLTTLSGEAARERLRLANRYP
jgi:hypothetical protein